jgi:pimeloyl-ACP methyl ester carboxylesterase
MARVHGHIRRLAIATTATAALWAAAPAQAARFVPCPGTKVFTCGQVTVPLDRSGAVPGTVHLAVERLRGRSGARSAVVAFPGGPGAATIDSRKAWVDVLGKALGGRDLLLFDQRGTGFSDHLDCGVYESGTPALALTRLASAKSVERCVAALGERRRFYSTRDTVDDIEAVRQAAGVDKLVLLGVSYGTRTALAYASAHPDHVERLVLDSVVPQGGTDPYLRNTLAAIPRVLTALCRGGGCDGVTADPAGDLRTLVGRLREKPLRLKRSLSFLGCRFRPAVTRSTLVDTLVAGDFGNPFLRAAMPAAVKAALSGDAEPLAVFGTGMESARLIDCLLGQLGFTADPGARLAADSPQTGDSEAVFVATLCTDGPLPWSASTPVWARRRAAEEWLAHTGDDVFGPFDRGTALSSEMLNLCKFWPETGEAAAAPAPPEVPALVLAGEDDLRTPAEDAFGVAQRIPGSQYVSVPDRGHSVIGNSKCADKALAAFLAGGLAVPCKRGAKHSPRPLTPLELRCFVYLTSGVASGKDLPRRPPPRLVRCVRLLERSGALKDLTG